MVGLMAATVGLSWARDLTLYFFVVPSNVEQDKRNGYNSRIWTAIDLFSSILSTVPHLTGLVMLQSTYYVCPRRLQSYCITNAQPHSNRHRWTSLRNSESSDKGDIFSWLKATLRISREGGKLPTYSQIPMILRQSSFCA
ncbi:hypothetical protein DFH11DRAFT_274250 [Phellopilus nigrolimitatus]|nr:hypothetical protein DFH11DRAFT_274250 [Phellopilus nigrolimitatus]